MRFCHVMVHEITHMFGLHHCIYYECLMNGTMSATEQQQCGIRILCPICLKKLKQNLKFNTTERFNELIYVCNQLGFTEEAQIYTQLIGALTYIEHECK